MRIEKRDFTVNGLTYTIRSATEQDAGELSALRLQIDGETENLDREKGEGYIDEAGFSELIRADAASSRNLFLVAVAEGQIVADRRVFALRRQPAEKIRAQGGVWRRSPASFLGIRHRETFVAGINRVGGSNRREKNGAARPGNE